MLPLLEQPLGEVLEDEQDPRQVVGEAVERHHALDRALGAFRGPGDALVRHLLGDVGLPTARGLGDLHLPVAAGVVGLVHTDDALGEGAELLELRPLVVRLAHRDAHVDVLGDRHTLGLAPAALAALAEHALDLLLEGVLEV